MSNDIFPGGEEFEWARLTVTPQPGDPAIDLTTLTVEVAVIPAGVKPVDADWHAPLQVQYPDATTVRARTRVDTEALLPGTKYNVWIRASGAGEVIPRVAGQLKRARF